jgi:uncharacterized membrane protein
MLAVRVVIVLLCAVGFYASVFMLRKSALAGRGRLPEPSVVESPRARLFGGLPNALFGCLYYAAVAAVSAFSAPVWLAAAAAAAAALAAAVSVYLAYSLLFVTRRSCPYCWIGHVTNWLLLPLLLFAAARGGYHGSV